MMTNDKSREYQAHPGGPDTDWTTEHARKPPMPPLTDNVTASAPLEFDLFWSMRSPYCYLVLDRILALNATYNVKVNFRPIMPIAIRDPDFFKTVPWYRWHYDMMDQHRVAKFLGVPFRRPNPEPVVQDTTTLTIPKDQPYIYRLTRLAAAAQAQDKGLEFLDQVMHLMWDGQTDNWQDHLVEAMDRAGMDGEETDADVAANPDKYDAIIQDNQDAHHATGHGGVPNMAFRQEPFFGQDRLDHLFWRLQQSGLTKRREALATLPTKSWTG
jgi:2-hydroxychromene-2-carboxylate isomerase